MRILFCNKYNFPFSGTEAYMFSLMKLLRDHGHETALFSMADPRGETSPYDRYFVPHIDFKQSRGFLRKARLAAHAIYSRDARQRLRQMIADFKPEVAHVRNIYHHLSPSILWELKAQNVPVLYHLNDFKMICPSYNMVRKGHACQACSGGRFWNVATQGCYPSSPGAYLLAAEAGLHRFLGTYRRCVTKFLAPSEFVKEKLLENGWPEKQIEVLPHFQELPEHVSPPPTGAPIIYFGRLSAEKGLPELILAMRSLPHIQLLIAGEGPQRADLETLVRELSLRNVHFVGQITGKQLEQRIAGSAFTVFPTRAYETLGKTILESYARQRPVIASDLGSRRELVEEGRTGLLFRPGDVSQLSAAISFLYDRPDLAAAMGRAGQDMVRQHHSPLRHYQRLLDLYEKLARPTPRKIRVAFIGGRGVVSKYSGIETYYEEVGKRLALMGHEVTVYCRNYFTPDLENYEGMRLLRLPTVRSKHLDTLVHTLLSSLHVLFTRAEIVHYHALGPSLFSWLPRLAGKKTSVTVQGLDWQRKKWGSFARSVLQLGENAAVRLPNQTMVVSRILQQHYRSEHGKSPIYIPNGTELRDRVSNGRLAEWNLEPDNYILFLGRFSPEKNCHLLIEAFERSEVPVKLVLAGGSSYSSQYIESLRSHGSERVKLLDYVSGEALQELLTNAMLFVLPSDMEGLSLALLDAMGAGVCVLASDIAENIELVNGAGFTFRRGDVEDLARMLRFLVANPGLRIEAGQKGRQHVAAHYLWPGITRQIEMAYLNLLGQQRLAPANAASANLAEVAEGEPAA